MDKIGPDGVKEELIQYGFAPESVEKYMQLFAEIEKQENPIAYLAEQLGNYMGEDVKQWMDEIIESVKATKSSDFEIVFDPTLVRGCLLYTSHTDSIKPGQKVVLVDDLIATGGTIEAAIRLIERLGGEVVDNLFLVELAGLKGRERLSDYRVDAVVTYEGK